MINKLIYIGISTAWLYSLNYNYKKYIVFPNPPKSSINKNI